MWWRGQKNQRERSLHACMAMTMEWNETNTCEGGGDVVGVVTPLVGGVANAFHDDQVVELRVQLGVQEVEGKEEDREGQVEVEEERRLKEVRSWMTMEMFMTKLRSWTNEVWDDITKCTRVRAMCELSVSCAPRKHLCKCRHWCTCYTLWAACNCVCSRHSTLWWCSWSHAWSPCSCCCCRFRRSHIAKNFLYLEVYFLHPLSDSKLLLAVTEYHCNSASNYVEKHSTNNWPNHRLAGFPDQSVLG